MLSTGIKNSILVILIILIFHFLIKNVLLNKKESFLNIVTSSSEVKDIDTNKPKNEYIDKVTETNSSSFQLLPNIKGQETKSDNSDKIEIMEYKNTDTKQKIGNNEKANVTFNDWFGEDEDNTHANGELDSFFTDNTDISGELEKASKCPLPIRDKSLPLTSTCDVNFDKLPDNVITKNVKSHTPERYMKSGMVLKEYDNENIMNGGKLFMGLDAYNVVDSAFASVVGAT